MSDAQTEAYRASTGTVAAAAATLAAARLEQIVTDPRDWLAFFPAYIEDIMPALMAAGARTAALAGTDYRATRRAEGIRGDFAFRPVLPEPAALTASLFATGGQALQGIEKHDMAPGVALKKARIDIQGSVVRHTMNAARNSTIANAARDREAIGALYVTKGDEKVCYWCAMLASRGPVFGDDSYDDADKLFTGTGTAKSHDHCRCVLKTVYREQSPLLDEYHRLEAEWRDVNWAPNWRELDPSVAHIRNSGKAALLAWRRHWEKR